MNRHSFRWTGLAFGAFFLAVAAHWAVWQAEALTSREIGYVVSGLLIAAGTVGVLLTLRSPRPTAAPEPEPTPETVEETPT